MAKTLAVILFTLLIFIPMAQNPPPKAKHNKVGPIKGNKSDKHKQSTIFPTASLPSQLIPIIPSAAAISIPNIYVNINSEQPDTNSISSQNNQCCSDNCCVSLTYSRSVAKKEDLLPELNSNGYFCENMDIVTTGDCDIHFIVFPLSSHCNLQQTVYSMRWVTQSQDAIGYQRAILENGILKLNNAETLYINPNDTNNPIRGFNALKFPVIPNQQISMCTLMGFGDIVHTINGQRIHIGYMGTNKGFGCDNDTVRDICSVKVDATIEFNIDDLRNSANRRGFKFDDGNFGTFEHGVSGHRYTSRDLMAYCIIFIVCFIVISICIVYVCYQRKIVNNIERDTIEEESLKI